MLRRKAVSTRPAPLASPVQGRRTLAYITASVQTHVHTVQVLVLYF